MMNALVGYRGNSLGNLTVTRAQQDSAFEQITSTIRAKYTANTEKAAKATDTSASTSVTAAANDELGRDAFLQLLVLELQNQDPLEPVDNSDMIAQLAQFSALEGTEKLNTSFELLSGNVDQLNFISAQGLLGKYVEGVNDSGEVATGVVNSVYLDGSIVVLNVDGEIVPMSSVLSIADEAPEVEESDTTETEEKRGLLKRLGDSIGDLVDKF